MPASIHVEFQRDAVYRVTVHRGARHTAHIVHLNDADWQQLTGGHAPREQLILHSFEFLLEREPQDSILPEFDLPIISRYFPEYRLEIHKRLGR